MIQAIQTAKISTILPVSHNRSLAAISTLSKFFFFPDFPASQLVVPVQARHAAQGELVNPGVMRVTQLLAVQVALPHDLDLFDRARQE